MRRLLTLALLASCLLPATLQARPGEAAPPGPTAPGCFLGLLPDSDRPADPRVALFRAGEPGACDALVLDTGYRLSEIGRASDRKALSRKRANFSCALRRGGGTLLNWEEKLLGMLAPGLRGEALLHLGRVEEALETFFQGLPDPLCAAWLDGAARNLPGPVARLLPAALGARGRRRAEGALEALGSLVAAHPAAALGSVEKALESRHRELRPRAILLAGEEAAGLRAGSPGSPEADALARRIEGALEARDPGLRAAAGRALLLAEPDGSRAIPLLASACRAEEDEGTRAVLLSALLEAGGVAEIFGLSHSDSPNVRRDALRAAAGTTAWPEGEVDPLIRLLREEGGDPAEVVRRLESRRGTLAGSWGEIFRVILSSLGEAEREAVPSLLCRLEGAPDGGEGASLLLAMARTESGRDARTAALEALGKCGGGRREESVAILLQAFEDRGRDGRERTAAASAAADLAVTPELYGRVLDSLRGALGTGDQTARLAAVAGLLHLGRADASRPAALLAAMALRTPPEPAGRAAEGALRSLFGLEPGPVLAALRKVGRALPEADQERVLDLIWRLQPEKHARILERWRAALSPAGAGLDPPLQGEILSLIDYWPEEILDLIRPAFERSRGEERILFLDLLVDLSRRLPDRVMPLLTLPAGSSSRLKEATQDAVAATLARLLLAEPARPPDRLQGMALDPADSERRLTGRKALWLLAWESYPRRAFLVPWAREARRTAAFPLRVELGRWLAWIAEMGPRKSPAWPEEDPAPRKARFLPGTSGDSAPAP